MALLVKDGQHHVGPTPSGYATLSQSIHVARAAKTLPATTTEIIFRVYGGRILVHALLGEVTTVIQSTDPILKVTAGRLDAAGALVGTVYDIASTLDMSSDEVGTIYTVEGDGTAIDSPQLAGAGRLGASKWVMPQGQIYITTGATKTGAIKWDLWYEPMDPGAYAVAVDVATAAIA